ncbi:hypothetical protein KXS07_19955 [Inquilinus limosus]|uniref:MauE/DoxX family redox-associated membrane protein n=1 Tax=Inquilinus limosus TaxID=171674 RepID=UPI003F146545
MIDPLLQLTSALLLALVFGAAAAAKLGHLETFEGVVQNYQILPHPLIRPFAYALPVVEAALAVAVLVPATRAAAALAALLLLAAFAAAIAVNVRRGRTAIDCGCFSDTLRQPISWWIVLRNLVLMAAALPCLAPASARALGVGDVATAALGAAALFTLSLAVGLVTKAPPPRYEDNYRASLRRA